MRSKEYLQEIRGIERLSRAVLKKIEVSGGEARFFLVTDQTYTKEDVLAAERISARYVPAGFTAKADVTKSMPDEKAVKSRIITFLKERFPAAAAFVSPDDVEVFTQGRGGRFLIGVDYGAEKQFSCGNVLDAVGAELDRSFCGAWFGEIKKIERDRGEIETRVVREEYVPAPRFFPVAFVSSLDGGKCENAKYIADLEDGEEVIAICGVLDGVQEKLTKKDKPWFLFRIHDGSGEIYVSYFTRKATLEKVRALKEGDEVYFTGYAETYNGKLGFRAKTVDFGAPPEGYVFESRASRSAPSEYTAVFPEPENDYVQADMFGGTPLPEGFEREKYVVFDLETTGLNPMGDYIIEVGAVRIEGGRITERFGSFVSCPVKVSAEITEITGIDDGMLVGAPPIQTVIADFYKFAYGYTLVAHNAAFDTKFIRRFGEEEGFLFDHRVLDTWALSQEALNLSNYKLNTIADHFGFTFRHHRAFEDAFVTAKIFIELVRLKGRVP